MGVVTIPDVEILRVGSWASALSGRVAITDDDLSSMLAAAADPEVDRCAIRIGHIDPRFDGEPALGWVANLRVVGKTLVADLTDVPSKLADLVRTAFSRRSAEISWGVKTPAGGKSYKATLSGLALLGVTPPAVKGLADVLARYSAPTLEATSTGTVFTIDDIADPVEAERAALAALSGWHGVRTSHSDLGGRDPQPSPEGAMTDEQIREMFGLAADATITDKMRTIAVASQQVPDPTPPPEPAPVPPLPEPAPAPTPAPTPPPVTTIDSAVLAELQRQAAEGAAANATLREQERDRDLAAALSAGRIAPASLVAWKAQYDANRDGTRALLASLPQAFSTVTTEAGMSSLSGADAAELHDDKAWAGFMATLGPDFSPPAQGS